MQCTRPETQHMAHDLQIAAAAAAATQLISDSLANEEDLFIDQPTDV